MCGSLLVGFGLLAAAAAAEPFYNDRPIIGVLSQEQSFYLRSKYPQENFTSYIAASYVKYVESAGARVVPIMIGKDRQYYKDVMLKLNGVVFPGGATYFNQSNGYADAGQMIFEIAKEFNDDGDHFPLFAICLGFQLLIVLDSGRAENRATCWSMDENLPLEFTDDYRSSRLFANAPDDVVDIFASDDVTYNYHQFCITDKNLKLYNLTDKWRVISKNDDENRFRFISTMEHYRYPFYGVQYHPEKIAFEWKDNRVVSRGARTLRANSYLMQFLVSEAGKSAHGFGSRSEENKYLIYNHIPYFTGAVGSAYHQCYMFEPRVPHVKAVLV